MVRLGPDCFASLLRLYRDVEPYFPLIAAVLGGTQDGSVFVDNADGPRQAYVEHRFGFAQSFGTPQPDFERALSNYLLVERQFAVAKIRLYAPLGPQFLQSNDCAALRSERQRFRLRRPISSAAAGVSPAPAFTVRSEHLAQIERQFGLLTRFWRTAEDFLAQAKAVVVLDQGDIASICYGAAIVDGKAEIDVLTSEALRGRGYAHAAVAGFIEACASAAIEPLWDCFTNNIPSVNTARSLGFQPSGLPYPFFTIPCRSRE
ncbi:GNAT family N-acetyltransferase [Tardiphaga sp. vice352]|uniref:GNAT family N-acetyltransferase n=1 Tax=Tardiphaga sp. vice352 TaxID=2592816 RepID=UPI0011658300|nr:GNAT family N-acetyltransferase [Tardiphaga sp. vice352]QDM33310.1 GNAT family N-acetyltransferase [Tardiphaga sp. vice352]